MPDITLNVIIIAGLVIVDYFFNNFFSAFQSRNEKFHQYIERVSQSPNLLEERLAGRETPDVEMPHYTLAEYITVVVDLLFYAFISVLLYKIWVIWPQ